MKWNCTQDDAPFRGSFKREIATFFSGERWRDKNARNYFLPHLCFLGPNALFLTQFTSSSASSHSGHATACTTAMSEKKKQQQKSESSVSVTLASPPHTQLSPPLPPFLSPSRKLLRSSLQAGGKEKEGEKEKGDWEARPLKPLSLSLKKSPPWKKKRPERSSSSSSSFSSPSPLVL